MKERMIKVLGDEELEFAGILQSLGMPRTVAILITYLAIAGEATSRQIQQATGLNQPEISITIRDIRDENWIDDREVKTGAKGRHSVAYSLRTPIDEIINRLEDEKKKEHAEAMENIRKLKRLV